MNSAEQILSQLDPEQRTAALAITGPVCVIAGAGTGKTRTMTHRIAYGCAIGRYEPRKVLALSFTRDAARELGGRISQLGVNEVRSRTFHSCALGQIRYFWPYVVGGDLPELLSQKTDIILSASKHHDISLNRNQLQAVAQEFEWIAVTMSDPDDYEQLCSSKRNLDFGLSAAEIMKLWRTYTEIKTYNQIIDFEDVLLLMIGILIEYPEVRAKLRDEIQYLVVDEYQDVSPLQHRLLDIWLGDNDNICVVGDASQTIYSFSGATPEYLLSFSRRFPQASVVKLIRDYRSTPQIVGLANQVIHLDQSNSGMFIRLESQLPSGLLPKWNVYEDSAEQASGVVTQIISIHNQKGIPYEKMAILARTNAQIIELGTALEEAGVPRCFSDKVPLLQRPTLKQALSVLAGGRKAYADIEIMQACKEIFSQLGWHKNSPDFLTPQSTEQWKDLSELYDLIRDFSLREDATYSSLLEFLQSNQNLSSTPGTVNLTSLHKAKGLEWEAVFLIDLHDGSLPYERSLSPLQIAEERRLLYVGVTRAKQHLYMSYAKKQNPHSLVARKVSRFLSSLWPIQHPH